MGRYYFALILWLGAVAAHAIDPTNTKFVGAYPFTVESIVQELPSTPLVYDDKSTYNRDFTFAGAQGSTDGGPGTYYDTAEEVAGCMGATGLRILSVAGVSTMHSDIFSSMTLTAFTGKKWAMGWTHATHITAQYPIYWYTDANNFSQYQYGNVWLFYAFNANYSLVNSGDIRGAIDSCDNFAHDYSNTPPGAEANHWHCQVIVSDGSVASFFTFYSQISRNPPTFNPLSFTVSVSTQEDFTNTGTFLKIGGDGIDNNNTSRAAFRMVWFSNDAFDPFTEEPWTIDEEEATPTPTETSTETPTPTGSSTASPSPTDTPTPTGSPTASPSPTQTPTVSATATPTPTATGTPFYYIQNNLWLRDVLYIRVNHGPSWENGR